LKFKKTILAIFAKNCLQNFHKSTKNTSHGGKSPIFDRNAPPYVKKVKAMDLRGVGVLLLKF